MKQCPNCQRSYDDGLQFCLQDGTPLVAATAANPFDAGDTESETLVAPKRVEPIRFDLPSSYQTNQESRQPPPFADQPVIVETPPAAARKSNTATVALLSILGTIAILGVGGLGAYLYLNSKKTEVAVNINGAPSNRPANQNAANNQNANAAAPTPVASPTPAPTLKPEQAKAITSDVQDVIDEWKATTENGDLDAHLSQYAGTVDYYNGGKVSQTRVRDDRARAFETYDTLSVNIDNVKVTPDATGEKATVVLDKEWDFEGVDKRSSGKVQQQLTFAKTGGKWKITGEKDLKVYYKQ